MKLTPMNAPSAPQPSGGYSQAIEVRDGQRLLFLSGQIPESPEGVVPSDFKEQARLVWSNLITQLTAAGMSVANLVKVTTYLARRADATDNSEIRQEILGDHRPALTVVIVEIYDERWLLEIEAVAVA